MEKEEEKKIMSIVNENGETEEVEVILAFEFKDNKKNMLYIQKMKQMKTEMLQFMYQM